MEDTDDNDIGSGIVSLISSLSEGAANIIGSLRSKKENNLGDYLTVDDNPNYSGDTYNIIGIALAFLFIITLIIIIIRK